MKTISVVLLLCCVAVVGLVMARSSSSSADAGEPEPIGARQNGDVNCSGSIDLSDGIYILNWLFLGSEPPCPLADPPDLVERINELERALSDRDAELQETRRALDESRSELARIREVCVAGCTDPDAVNFDQNATIDDDSCEFEGCTDRESINYDPRADIDDGSCGDLPLIDGFTLLTDSNEKGLPEYRHDRTSIVMVMLPGGTFTMGSPADEIESTEIERPQHEVSVSPFLIAKYEVDWTQWANAVSIGFVRNTCGTSDNFVENSWCRRSRHHCAPASVSWNQARTFCETMQLELPTEAQWEYACRAGTDTPFSFGETLNPRDATFRESGHHPPTIHCVETKSPNAFTLHNMHGNEREWCLDAYDPDFYSTADATKPNPVARADPDDPDSGLFRVARVLSIRVS